MATPTPPTWPDPPPSIGANPVYTDGDLRLLLGLTSSTLTRARREGRLRFSRQGHRTLHLGRWVIEWLENDADAAGEKGGGK